MDLSQQRRMMVDGQVRTFDVTDSGVIAAMAQTPRELFVPARFRALAYSDLPLRLDDGADPGLARFMLIPMVAARMIQALGVKPGERVLDVAAGTGYTAALLASLGAHVVAIESLPGLAKAATDNLAALGRSDVSVVSGPLSAGWAAQAPYDAIFVNGALWDEPKALLAQLRAGGRLVVVIGGGRAGSATLFTKGATGEVGRRPLFDAAAAPAVDARPADQFVF